MERSVDFLASVSVTRIACDGSRTSVATINFRSLSIDETRDGKKKTSLRDVRKTPIERTEENASALLQSRAGSHQRLRTASKVQNAFPRRAIPSEGKADRRRKSRSTSGFSFIDTAVLITTNVSSPSFPPVLEWTFGEDRFDIHWAKIYPPVIFPEHSSRYSTVRMRYRNTMAT